MLNLYLWLVGRLHDECIKVFVALAPYWLTITASMFIPSLGLRSFGWVEAASKVNMLNRCPNLLERSRIVETLY